MDRFIKRASALGLFALVLCLPHVSLAQTPSEKTLKITKSGQIWLHVSDRADANAWPARALAGALTYNLASFGRVSLADTLTLRDFGCSSYNLDCILRSAQAHNVDIVIDGALNGRQVSLTSYETWTRTPVAQENLTLNDRFTIDDFRHKTYRMIKPFVEIGGLLDQHAVERKTHVEEPAAPFSPGALFAFAIAVAVLFWLPRLSAELIMSSSKSEYKIPDRLNRRALALSIGLAAAWVTLAWLCASARVAAFVNFVPAGAYFLAGALWAYAAVLTRKLVTPRVHAMEQIEYVDLFTVLRAWMIVTLGRLPVFVVALLPFAFAAKFFASSMALDTLHTWGLAAPLATLSGCAWYSLWIGHLAMLPKKGRIGRYFLHFLDRRSIDVTNQVTQHGAFKYKALTGVVTIAAVFTFAGLIVRDSWRYHPVYLERIDRMTKKVEAQKHLEQEKQNGSK